MRFVVLLLLLAAVLYGIFWAIDRRNNGGSAAAPRPTPRGPVGPDDDDAFLRDLDRQRRRRQSGPPADPNPPTDPHPPNSQETHDHPE